MNMPGFSAEESLYKASGRYQAISNLANSAGQMVTPAIPACRNCDDILDKCLANGGYPRAACNACARGYCYDEAPTPNPFPDPFPRLPRF